MPSKQGRVVGIYLADDEIAVGSQLDPSSGSFPRPEPDLIIKRITNNAPLEDHLSEAMNFALSVHRKHNIRVFSIASPGPLLNSGSIVHYTNGYGLRAFDYRHSTLTDKNIVNIFRSVAKNTYSHQALSKDVEDPHVIINHDAAAVAFGDYHFRALREFHSAPIRKNSAKALSDFMRKHGKGRIHAHVIVNEGIGGAIISNGHIFQGSMHSEMGHLHVQRHPDDLHDFRFMCAGHLRNDCIESLAALPSLRLRWGADAVQAISQWDFDDPRLYQMSFYFAQLCATLVVLIGPNNIVLSGKVFKNRHLVKMVRGYFAQMLAARHNEQELFPGYESQQRNRFIDCELNENADIYGCCLLGCKFYYNLETTDNAPIVSLEAFRKGH